MPDLIGKTVVTAIVVGLAWASWHAWGIRRASPAWPSVEGEMISAKARARNETGDQRGTPSHEWFTEVRYRYTVAGVPYEGTRLRAFSPVHFDEQHALAEIAPFPPGARVRVYYDPAKPSSSVLVPG